MKNLLTYLTILASIILGPISTQAQSTEEAKEKGKGIISKLDAAAKAHAADSAVSGVAVGVVHKGDTLLMDGYGMADLEFDVPMPKDAVFEIGSVTKQFTAAAILQLAGKDSLDLDDNINAYLPDYDTRGHMVTIRQLLHHTSGIRNFTSMASVRNLFNESMARDTILSLVEKEPFRFAPGTAMSYSNTGYFILGFIIEEASGQSYASYVAEHITGPAGMENTYYCNEREVTKKKSHGYKNHPNKGLRHKSYWTHFWPYSAGSLCSTARDLVTWNQVLHNGKLLADSLYQQMITPGQLSDGTNLRYGMGLGINKNHGHSVIGHGGGIAGYLSESRHYPSQDLSIVVLQNTSSPPAPQVLADSLAQLVLGTKDEPEDNSYTSNLDELGGRYTGPYRGGIMDLMIKKSDGKLIASQVGSKEADTLRYDSGLTWKYGDNHYRFVRSGDQVVELRLDVVGGHYILRRIRNN